MPSPTITVRLSPHDMVRIEVYVHERQQRHKHDPFSLSDFVRMAIQEKLAHLARAGRCRLKEPQLVGLDCHHCLTVNNERVAVTDGKCPVCGRKVGE